MPDRICQQKHDRIMFCLMAAIREGQSATEWFVTDEYSGEIGPSWISDEDFNTYRITASTLNRQSGRIIHRTQNGKLGLLLGR